MSWLQVQYSLLSQGKLQRDTKAACDDLGLKLIAYSPLALGMLTGRYSTSGDASLPSGAPTVMPAPCMGSECEAYHNYCTCGFALPSNALAMPNVRSRPQLAQPQQHLWPARPRSRAVETKSVA